MVPGRWRGGTLRMYLTGPAQGWGDNAVRFAFAFVDGARGYPTGSRQLCGRWGCKQLAREFRQLSVDRGVRAGLLQGGVGSRWTLCKRKVRYPRAVLPSPLSLFGEWKAGDGLMRCSMAGWLMVDLREV